MTQFSFDALLITLVRTLPKVTSFFLKFLVGLLTRVLSLHFGGMLEVLQLRRVSNRVRSEPIAYGYPEEA